MPTAGQIADFLGVDVEAFADDWRTYEIEAPSSLTEASAGTLVFLKTPGVDIAEALGATAPTMIIAPMSARVEAAGMRSHGVACVARVENPRLAFATVVSAFFLRDAVPGIHPSAAIAASATIGQRVSIGAHATIGEATIGDDTVIDAGVRVYDGVVIGNRVRVFANAVLGADGFGFERGADGEPVKFPQIGGVVIEDDVEIGAGTCVDRGALSNTRVCRNAKIDNMVHVAHNVVVGEGTLIAANAVIAGSTVLGRGVWVGPSACVSNGLVVGSGASVSLGAVVTRDVPEGTRVTGNFATDHAKFMANLRRQSDRIG
ncbi:MAG: UDP-3-O-(3-hydroxymyristoyl)glucosamine N-acyltransferase [Actinobacteria bacterium]|nr:MAG: UDP-3-O-(3-hydroxymyristoyl)glucosamine N-acyltransferase [Actinomycetota bacterium]